MINYISRICSWSIVFLFLFSCQNSFAGTVSGELKKWHKVTVSFDGPNTSETANPNPFTDFKLQVTFTNGTTTYNVPGYYAADGNAANSSSTAGNKWLVHFAPDKTGVWSYTASFRQGTDVALNTSATAGTPAGFMDGETGTFNIAATDKTGRDHRGKGRLKYVGEHYLQYQETGDYFVKMGADAPENMFAYNDFDDVPNRGNRRKTWSPHAGDYNAADAAAYTWKSGQGTEILGAIKYLSDKGMNVFSFLTLSLHGDDENVFPHLLKVNEGTYNGYNDAQQWANGVHHDRFDISRLAQWEKVMEYADKKGMYMHYKTLETENDNIMDANTFGRERRVYYRELIARFGHHLALNWNLSEEITLSAGVITSTSNYIKAVDPYDHIVVYHTYPGQKNKYNDHLGPNFNVDGASLQTSNGDYNEVRANVTEWVDKSRNAGKKWVVALDEPGTAGIGVNSDPSDRKKVRSKVVWNTLMAGGAGAEFYYGYQSGSCTDLTCQDHRTRDQKYTDAAFALHFFDTYIPFHEMIENDARTTVGTDYVFEKDGEVYAVYLPDGGSTNINLPAGNWVVQWYNPRDGVMQTNTTEVNGSISAPDGNDWAALITNCNGFEEVNGMVVIETESLDISGTDWQVETAASGYTGGGYIEWKGANSFGTPGNGLVETSITINTPGTYKVQWRSRVGFGTDPTEHNDTWLKFPDADEYFAEKTGSIVYPIGSGQTPNPNGAGAAGWFKVYSSGALNWTWSTFTSDNDGHIIFARFDSPGVYTLQISGRSQFHQIDRIVMSLPSAPNPTALTNAQTACNGSCVVGASCDDNDACTANDVFDTNCNCNGTFQDADNDTVCDNDDVCPNFDDTLIGTPCDDNNPATNIDVYTANCICEGSVGTTTICLEPIQDAYLQGAGGTRINNEELRVELANRFSYLKYDLSNIAGTIISAELNMTVGTDAGSGRIMIEKGSTNNWTETNLSNTNKPAAAGLLGELTQSYAVNGSYTWPLNGVTLGGEFSIIATHTSGNDVSFKSKENPDVPGRPMLCLTVQAPQPVNQTVECDVQFLLEGTYDGQSGMTTNLQSLNLLPSGQPYTTAPWNYNGTEGAGWTPADYPTGSVDWVLISMRTSPLAADEVGQGAVVLLNDGTTYENVTADIDFAITELYLVVEHRNHLPVMTPNPIPIVNGMVTYNFKSADSYSSGPGLGQKFIGTNWVMYAANADQSLDTGYEITGADNILWQASNGLPGVYQGADFNLDGDVTGADKVMWSYNNGVFSSIPK